MNVPQQDDDAYIDSWSVVPLIPGGRIPFGFAVYHPTTGGLSWVISTAIRHLDESAGRAITASGRRYRHGRRIDLESIPMEGEEARLAYDLLIGSDADDRDAVPSFSTDREYDAIWVTACKIARHLGGAPPDRAALVVREFVKRHIEAYLHLKMMRRQN